MSSDQTIAEKLIEIFGDNPYHARASVAGNGDIFYAPVEGQVSLEDMESHLDGRLCLGAYQLIHGADTVKFLGWDVDSKDINVARNLVKEIVKHLNSVPYAVEFSGGKGYHVLIFLKTPMPAIRAKKVVDFIREKEGFAMTGESHVECFPKQERLLKSRPKGNLLKIPLGEHPRSHNRSVFVDPLNGYESGPSLDPCTVLSYKADPDDVMALIDEAPEATTQLVQLLSPFWDDGKRHDLSLYLSGFLAHEQWGIDQSKDLVTKICQNVGDVEVYNRLQTVESTFEKQKEGKSIRGRQGLGEYLPASVMQKLTELVSLMKAPDTVAQIDEIRYSKGRPNLENARLASNTIWSILNDNGSKVFQTTSSIAYWYHVEDHTVIEEGTEMWRSILNKQFGMNPQDGFSKLVYNEIRLRIVREAPFVPIQNRTFWNENTSKLFINLGGPEVYIVDGKSIEKQWNGECGQMFITNENGIYVVPDFEAEPINCWDYLVNDLSFTTSQEAPSKPEEQRELFKAWLFAFFFQELMPTKPILSMLGVPGSGKTTAIRRVLRILENPDSDVLGVPTDKQDAFRASIASHRLLVLDNLEKSGAFWMVDILNKLATGSNIELRELYKTNAKHTIIPKCFVACTAVNMPFSDETLFSRLLVLEMQKLSDPIAEHIMQRKIQEHGAAIWADLILKLNEVVLNIVKNKTVKAPTKSRLVDFTVFCERIKNCSSIDSSKLTLGLLSMVDAQLRQLKESSQAVTLIEEWISARAQEAAEWHTYQEIYVFLQGMAQARHIDFKWKNPVGLGRHLATLQDRLVQDFGAEFFEVISPDQTKTATKIRFKTLV